MKQNLFTYPVLHLECQNSILRAKVINQHLHSIMLSKVYHLYHVAKSLTDCNASLLFDLICYLFQSTIFQICQDIGLPYELNQYLEQGLMCLAQGHNIQ